MGVQLCPALYRSKDFSVSAPGVQEQSFEAVGASTAEGARKSRLFAVYRFPGVTTPHRFAGGGGKHRYFERSSAPPQETSCRGAIRPYFAARRMSCTWIACLRGVAEAGISRGSGSRLWGSQKTKNDLVGGRVTGIPDNECADSAPGNGVPVEHRKGSKMALVRGRSLQRGRTPSNPPVSPVAQRERVEREA